MLKTSNVSNVVFINSVSREIVFKKKFLNVHNTKNKKSIVV